MSWIVSSSERPDAFAPSWAPGFWITGGRCSGNDAVGQEDRALEDVL